MLLKVYKEIPLKDGRKIPYGKVAVTDDPSFKEGGDVKFHVKFDEDVETFPELVFNEEDFRKHFVIMIFESDELNRTFFNLKT